MCAQDVHTRPCTSSSSSSLWSVGLSPPIEPVSNRNRVGFNSPSNPKFNPKIPSKRTQGTGGLEDRVVGHESQASMRSRQGIDISDQCWPRRETSDTPSATKEGRCVEGFRGDASLACLQVHACNVAASAHTPRAHAPWTLHQRVPNRCIANLHAFQAVAFHSSTWKRSNTRSNPSRGRETSPS